MSMAMPTLATVVEASTTMTTKMIVSAAPLRGIGRLDLPGHLIIRSLRHSQIKMICCDSECNSLCVELEMELSNGSSKGGMLHLHEQLINFGMLSQRFAFFLKDGEHLLK